MHLQLFSLKFLYKMRFQFENLKKFKFKRVENATKDYQLTPLFSLASSHYRQALISEAQKAPRPAGARGAYARPPCQRAGPRRPGRRVGGWPPAGSAAATDQSLLQLGR